MADNVQINGGPVTASDDVGGIQFQRVKVALGADGQFNGDVSSSNPLPIAGTVGITPDDTANIVSMLRALVHPIWEESSTGRLRVVIDPLGGAQTLGTVTTVGTVSNQTSMGNVRADTMVYDNMHAAWASSVRRAVS